MANDSVGVAAASSPTNYIDNESISTGGSPATVDRQRVRVGGAGYTDLADVVAGDTGQSGQVVHGSRKEVTYSTTTVQAVATTDCSSYRWVSVHQTSFTSGTATFQISNDNINWVAVSLGKPDTTGGSTSNNSANVTGIWAGPIHARYFRINVTSITGTTAGTIEFFSVPPPVGRVFLDNTILNVSQVGSATTTDAAANSFQNWGVATLNASAMWGYNGATWDRTRLPAKVFTATATASGDTALWTPTASKKFRLLRYMIEVTGQAATASGASIDVVLRDGTTATAAASSFYVPATGGTALGSYATPWVDLGNGILSAAANNVLNINLSAALSAGKVRVVAAGVEE